MKVFRWKVVGTLPPGDKFILIGAPHTSNWDFLFALAAFHLLRIDVSWIGKETLFRKPFGGIMKRLGGIAVKRGSKQGIVEQIAQRFKNAQKLIIAIAPSGTRKKKDHWKSGFYWIALNAKVPIICGYLDYRKREAGIGLSFIPTGNIVEDMNRIREFYNGIQGKYPDMVTTVRLPDETEGVN